MKKQHLLFAAAALLLISSLTGCKKDAPIMGKLWQWDCTTAIFGDETQASVRLIAGTENSGILFVVVEEEGSPWDMAFACPFTYTSKGNEGSLSVDLGYLANYDESMNYSTVSMPWSYDEASGQMSLKITDIAHFLEVEDIDITLAEKPLATRSQWKGTTWTADMAEYEGDDYTISVTFDSEKAATITSSYTFDGELEKEIYQGEYTYAGGLGDLIVTVYGEKSHGGFYLIDDNTLFLSDGFNLITMAKQ